MRSHLYVFTNRSDVFVLALSRHMVKLEQKMLFFLNYVQFRPANYLWNSHSFSWLITLIGKDYLHIFTYKGSILYISGV